jgi:hypothetical protein
MGNADKEAVHESPDDIDASIHGGQIIHQIQAEVHPGREGIDLGGRKSGHDKHHIKRQNHDKTDQDKDNVKRRLPP